MPARAALQDSAEHAARATFTSNRVERILGILVGAACVIFGLQAFLAATGSTDLGRWHDPVMWITFGSLVLMIIAMTSGIAPLWGAAQFAVIFPLVLIAWPFLADRAVALPGAQPWIWYLVNVATVTAAVAFTTWAQIVWTVAMPIGYAAVRSIQGGTVEFIATTASDASFALIFGFVLLLLVRTFRSVSASVDEARAQALASYAAVTEADAVERERLATAALIHDSVLSALIAAERADSDRERELAVGMAREALTGLADAEGESDDVSDAPVSTAQIALDIEDGVASAFGLRLIIAPPDDAPIPGPVARALTLAALQAVANAVQHAEARGLAVAVLTQGGGCSVIVRDGGAGMNVDDVPDDRLGIRASIFARMSAVGGRADLQSGPTGTRVVMRWTP